MGDKFTISQILEMVVGEGERYTEQPKSLWPFSDEDITTYTLMSW